MNEYRIFETNEFIKKLEKITKKDRLFIKKKLIQNIYPQIKEEPHYGSNIKKLVDYTPNTWRYRIGKYRLFYVIDESEKIIYVITISIRKDAY